MKVLVGSVDSAEGRAAVQAAAEEVRANGGVLYLVSYLLTPDSDPQAMEHRRQLAAERERLEGEAERLRDEMNIACEVHLVQNSIRTSDALLRLAEELGVDRIVIGTRRRSPIGKALLGSTAQELLLGSPVPVLAVKAGGDPTEI